MVKDVVLRKDFGVIVMKVSRRGLGLCLSLKSDFVKVNDLVVGDFVVVSFLEQHRIKE